MAWQALLLLLLTLAAPCMGGSAFLSWSPLSEDDADTDSNTTTTAPSTTATTTPASASAHTRGMVIRGGGGPNAGLVSGHYKIGDMVNGQPAWVKVTDSRMWLLFVTNGASGAWMVAPSEGNSSDVAVAGGYLRGTCQGSCLPSDVKSWEVSTDGSWAPAGNVKVHELDESLASDWFAPALSMAAAAVAILAASAGSGSSQKGSEHSSMKGVWSTVSERYTVSVDAQTPLPAVLVSVLSLAFPMPVAAGELRLSLQPSSAPNVHVEFRKEERGPLAWHSDGGAMIRRLSRDKAEFTAPGLEPQMLCREADGSRSRALPVTWLLLAGVWLKPPLDAKMAGALVALGLLQMTLSAVAVRFNFSASRCGGLLRGAAVSFPLICLLTFDYYSQTLSGSITALALLSLHVLSMLGPRLIETRPSHLAAAGLAGWLCVAMTVVLFFVGALVYLDLAWAFDRSKAVVALACLGSWLAVPMQVGQNEMVTEAPTLVVLEKAGGEPLLDEKEDVARFMSQDETTIGDESEPGTLSRSEGSYCESLEAARSRQHSRSSLAGPPASSSAAHLQPWSVHATPSLRPEAAVVADKQLTLSSHGSEKSRSLARSSSRRRAHMSREASPRAPGNKEDLLLAMLEVPATPAGESARPARASQRSVESSRSRHQPRSPAGSQTLEDATAARDGKMRASRGRSPRHPEQPEAITQPSLQSSISTSADAPRSKSRSRGDRATQPRSLSERSTAERGRGVAPTSTRDRGAEPGTPRARRSGKRSESNSVSLSAMSAASAPVAADPMSLSLHTPERSRSMGPSSSNSMAGSAHSRSKSERPVPTAVGDKFVFLPKSNRVYDSRCRERETVTVVKVGGFPPVKVQWSNGFTQQVLMQDLASEIPAMPDVPQEKTTRPSWSFSRRAVRQMPDMPAYGGFMDMPTLTVDRRDDDTLEGGFMDF